MNSYSLIRPKRKTAWVLFQWKGWCKDETDSFTHILHHNTLLFLSQTHAHFNKYSKVSLYLDTHLCICITASPSLREANYIPMDQKPLSTLLHLTLPHSKTHLIQESITQKFKNTWKCLWSFLRTSRSGYLLVDLRQLSYTMSAGLWHFDIYFILNCS